MTHGDGHAIPESVAIIRFCSAISQSHILAKQTRAIPKRCSVMKILSKPAPSNFCHDLTLCIGKLVKPSEVFRSELLLLKIWEYLGRSDRMGPQWAIASVARIQRIEICPLQLLLIQIAHPIPTGYPQKLFQSYHHLGLCQNRGTPQTHLNFCSETTNLRCHS